MKRLLTSGAIALGLLTAPLAQAAAPARASSPVSDASELSGGLPLSALIVLLTVLAGAIYLVVDDDDSDSP